MATITQNVTAYERMARSRKFVGLDQREMANLLGVNRNTVSNWETGVTEPTMSMFASWARITGRSMEWIVYGDDEAPGAAPGAADVPGRTFVPVVATPDTLAELLELWGVHPVLS